MTIEDEMRSEIKRLEGELREIDEELTKLYDRLVELLKMKKRKEKDLRVLKAYFGLEKDEQRTLNAI